jgi:hypothetical protein
MKASIWQPISGIVGPCADISFALSHKDTLIVTMHFSLVRRHPNRDLRLQFEHAVAMHWEQEYPGFYPVPQNMSPFPLQKVEGSELLEQFSMDYGFTSGPRLTHFLLLSMNDLVHIIAYDDATAVWIPGIADEFPELEKVPKQHLTLDFDGQLITGLEVTMTLWKSVMKIESGPTDLINSIKQQDYRSNSTEGHGILAKFQLDVSDKWHHCIILKIEDDNMLVFRMISPSTYNALHFDTDSFR